MHTVALDMLLDRDIPLRGRAWSRLVDAAAALIAPLAATAADRMRRNGSSSE